MKKITLLLSILFLGLTAFAQEPTPTATPKPKAKIFRATKEQVSDAQKMLKDKGLCTCDASGKLDDATRGALKKYQSENGLKDTGTLNRATLEKLGIALTDEQKAMPIPESSYAKEKGDKSKEDKPKKQAVFRANKDQVKMAQAKLREGKMLTGGDDGKLDDATRAALKDYQKANGLKETGTLNRDTLEKMGIPLTDAQKASGEAKSEKPSDGEKSKSKGVFRATKDQIQQAQQKLKAAKLYTGEETGKMDDAVRSALKTWQKDNGLKETGTLNKETLEKLGIELTDKQKEM